MKNSGKNQGSWGVDHESLLSCQSIRGNNNKRNSHLFSADLSSTRVGSTSARCGVLFLEQRLVVEPIRF